MEDGHRLHNRSDKPCVYVAISGGDRAKDSGEYPDIDLVFDAEGTEHEYSGALTPTDIVSFVDGFAADRATHSRKVLAEESAALAQVGSGN